ncbi:MAG: cation transporter, partial [Candidatus Binatia bacterium]
MSTDGRTTILVSGMHCAGCVGAVERALSAVPGVSSTNVNLATGQAVVLHEPGLGPDTLGEAVRHAGYGYEGVDSAETDLAVQAAGRAEERSLRRRVVAGVILSALIVAGS